MLISNKTDLKERRRELRRRSTPAESILWIYLRRKALGQKIYRQFSIGNYIADFCYPRAKLIIEVDGDIHDNPDVKEYDKERTGFLEAVNYKVVRFTNRQILEDPESVVDEIKTHLSSRGRPLLC